MSRNLRKGSGGAQAGVNIQGGQIENTPIGKASARSANFDAAAAATLSVSGVTNLAGGSTLPAGTVLAGATFRDSSQGASASGQTGVLTLSVDAKTAFIPMYSTSAPTTGGKVAQVQTATNANYSDIGSTIPLDDTIPQQDEGVELVTVTITPTNASSVLHIVASLTFLIVGSKNVVMAVFKDAVADAIAANSGGVDATFFRTQQTLETFVSAASVAAATYKLRVGTDTGASVYINGSSTARQLGGVAVTRLTVTEYTP